jgi:arsenate reductase/regulatory protein spx
MITAFLYNSCTSCRKTEDVLKQSGVEYEKREFFKHRFTPEELRSLLDTVGLKPSDVLSTRSRVYKERNLAEADLTEDQMVELMVEEPTLLRRPIIVNGDRVVVGYNEAKLRDLIGAGS